MEVWCTKADSRKIKPLEMATSRTRLATFSKLRKASEKIMPIQEQSATASSRTDAAFHSPMVTNSSEITKMEDQTDMVRCSTKIRFYACRRA